MNEYEVCGSCEHYDELSNGYCDRLGAFVESEELCCKQYEMCEEKKEERKCKTLL